MRAITVRQPWAWAIVHGGKDVENRTRNLAGAYRGPVAIHAALTIAADAAIDIQVQGAIERYYAEHGRGEPGGRMSTGAIIGVADLVDAHPADYLPDPGGDERAYMACSPWAQYPNWPMDPMWHLVLKNPRALAEPIPYRGRLGLWTLPDDVAATLTDRTATEGES